MACRYFTFFHSYLFLILVFHNSLEGQNQFGRIFKENANPLFKEEIKQDTILKQKIVSEELLIKRDIIDTVTVNSEKAEFESSKFDTNKLENPIIVNPLVLSDDLVPSKTEKKKIVTLKSILPIDSVTIINGIYYMIDTNQKYSGRIIDKWENGGNKTDIRIKDGLRHGASKEWFESGQKMLTSIWKNGLRHGYSRQWYDNAQLKSKGKYLLGKNMRFGLNTFQMVRYQIK